MLAYSFAFVCSLDIVLLLQGLCELLCETPYHVPSGLVPSLEDLKGVEEHIKIMEKEKVRLSLDIYTCSFKLVCMEA